LAALAQPTRLDVFRLLTKPDGLAAGDIARTLAVPQNTMSSHLAILSRVPERIYNVLFLCTGNTARSILAESILRKDGRRNFRASSAGSQPKGTVNPFAIKVLDRLGYATDGLRSKKGVRLCRPSELVLDLLDNPVESFVKEDGEAVTRAKG
jgi:DNA-binding transcriptional ArsR family regulator